jgi:hypothetical protein
MGLRFRKNVKTVFGRPDIAFCGLWVAVFVDGDYWHGIYCGDARGQCEYSRRQAPDEGLPLMVVDEEIYRRPPAMLIATVDKFAQMAWQGRCRLCPDR